MEKYKVIDRKEIGPKLFESENVLTRSHNLKKLQYSQNNLIDQTRDALNSSFKINQIKNQKKSFIDNNGGIVEKRKKAFKIQKGQKLINFPVLSVKRKASQDSSKKSTSSVTDFIASQQNLKKIKLGKFYTPKMEGGTILEKNMFLEISSDSF